MTVTAARLGSAPLTFDWSRLHPLPEIDSSTLKETWAKLKYQFTSKEVGFYDSPIDSSLSQAQETVQFAQHVLDRGGFTDCLFLGIGGSALGPLSLISALREEMSSHLRFLFVENPDPIEWKSTLSQLKPDSTIVCVVSKSGGTFETLAQALLALTWLEKKRWTTNVVFITDPKKGELKAFADENRIPTLSIDPSIGGRFSVFSPVGLLPLALSGLSVENFLLGAKQVRDYTEKTSTDKNPIFILSQILIDQYPKRTTHVLMPYATRLRALGDWFVQLWGESLGKDGKGFTPLGALGATDQHSILQLLRDGPDDKTVFFLTLDQVKDEVKIPALSKTLTTFRMLEGHTLHQLLKMEYQATSLVLTKRSRPHLSIHLDSLDERSLGAFYFGFCLCASFLGTLWKINPFDQPGVEEGKNYIQEALVNRESVGNNSDR